jgi:hypothetical protein
MAFSASLLLLILSYFVDSWPYSFGGELTAGQWVERIKYIAFDERDNLPDSLLLVNVTYDKDLMPYRALHDSKSDTCKTREFVGTNSVTDRRKLLSFLRKIRAFDNYRYVILDIRFEEGFVQDAVSDSLFNCIERMDRICIARHHRLPITDTALCRKAAYCDYKASFLETDLVKYPLITSEELSLPAKMYQDLHGARFSSFGGLHFCNGYLCRSSIFLTYPVKVTRWHSYNKTKMFGEDVIDDVQQYYNLGTGILAINDADLEPMVNGKIIVVGDFVEDIHDTYIGQLPGALASVNAYIGLVNNVHRVGIVPCLILLVIYTLLAYTVIRRKSLFEYFEIFNTKSYLLKLIMSFFGYSLVLSVITTMYYLLFKEFYSIVFPALYFTVLNLICKIHYKSL